MAEVELTKRLECLKCGHKWLPRQPKVFRCPSCQSFTWDVAKES